MALQRRLQGEGGLVWQQMQRLRSAHLPHGAPSSPALATLCAFRLVLRLDGLARVPGARHSRYVDDIVLSGGPPLAAARQRIAAWVGSIALDEGFALNHRKTRCLHAAQSQQVCHIGVNRHANLPRADFDRLKAVLHLCATRGISRGGCTAPVESSQGQPSRWRLQQVAHMPAAAGAQRVFGGKAAID